MVNVGFSSSKILDWIKLPRQVLGKNLSFILDGAMWLKCHLQTIHCPAQFPIEIEISNCKWKFQLELNILIDIENLIESENSNWIWNFQLKLKFPIKI